MTGQARQCSHPWHDQLRNAVYAGADGDSGCGQPSRHRHADRRLRAERGRIRRRCWQTWRPRCRRSTCRWSCHLPWRSINRSQRFVRLQRSQRQRHDPRQFAARKSELQLEWLGGQLRWFRNPVRWRWPDWEHWVWAWPLGVPWTCRVALALPDLLARLQLTISPASEPSGFPGGSFCAPSKCGHRTPSRRWPPAGEPCGAFESYRGLRRRPVPPSARWLLDARTRKSRIMPHASLPPSRSGSLLAAGDDRPA